MKNPPRTNRRAMAAISAVIAILVLNLVIVSMVLGAGRDGSLTVHRLDSVHAFYAGEGAANMSIREMRLNYDEDADGAVGSISDDANATNDPAIGAGRAFVTRTDDTTNATLRSAGRAGASRRAIEAQCPLDTSDLPFEVGNVSVGSVAATVNLSKKYDSPVVVCTTRYSSNTLPIVVRVDTVTSTSFDVWLQNPGDGATPLTEDVSYIVMEEGAYDIDGVTFEAQTYTSTVTDTASSWVGEVQSYTNTYTSPVVIGQVMSANDALWSVFWSRGNSRSNAPSATVLYTGKHVAEDSTTARANETVGFIVFESGNDTLGRIELDVQLTPDTVRGPTNSPPYSISFNTTFATVPEILLVSAPAMDGVNGGWPVIDGDPGATTTATTLLFDEDQVNDAERSHTTEEVALIVFEAAGVMPAVIAWTEVKP